MVDKYSRVELLAIIKSFNKDNNDKIKNTDKMKKDELLQLCQSFSLLSSSDTADGVTNINLRNLSKNSLIQDITLYFIKQAKEVPAEVLAMKKQELVDFMEIHNIAHYTPELIKKEIKHYMAEDNAKKVIYYNMIRYDNVNYEDIDTGHFAEYVESQNLDQDLQHFNEYAKMLHTIYVAYDKFCEATSSEVQTDKIKSFPKIIQHLKKVTENKS